MNNYLCKNIKTFCFITADSLPDLEGIYSNDKSRRVCFNSNFIPSVVNDRVNNVCLI